LSAQKVAMMLKHKVMEAADIARTR
jgi:hypothetical protein